MENMTSTVENMTWGRMENMTPTVENEDTDPPPRKTTERTYAEV